MPTTLSYTEIWNIFMLGSVIYSSSSASFCVRRFVDGKWISKGFCRGTAKTPKILREVQLKANDEKEWIVCQRRIRGYEDFSRNWDDYVKGFGDPAGDFWLGLEKMHQRTKNGEMELKIDMITTSEVRLIAKYSTFQVGPSSDKYRLTVKGYSGNATNGLSPHNNQQFSTKDAEHDTNPNVNCAVRHEGGWWFHGCVHANLNGNFMKKGWPGIWWIKAAANRMRYTEMKIRKKNVT